MIDKQQMFESVLADLHSQLTLSKQAASSAHAQATHTESVAESRYDTLGLEQAYLAHGQSVRAQECALEIKSILKLQHLVFNKESKSNTDTDTEQISLGAIIKLKRAKLKTVNTNPQNSSYFFILPIKGGTLLTMNNIDIRVISNNSPLGKSLLDKHLDDEITVNQQNYLIQDIL